MAIRINVTRLVVSFSAAITVLAGLLYWSYAKVEQRKLVADWYRESGALALSLSEHVRATLRDTNNTVHSVADFVQDFGGIESLSPAQLSRAAQREVRDSSAVSAILVIDRKGVVVGASGSMPRDVDVASLQWHKDNIKDGAVHVGAIQRSLKDPSDYVIPVSRAIFSKNGALEGVVVAHLDTRYIRSFYRTLAVRPDTLLVLQNISGQLIARSPNIPEAIGRSFSNLPFDSSSYPLATMTQAERTSPLDHIPRYVTYQQVSNLPLIVTVGLSQREVHNLWKQQVGQAGLVLGAALILLWGMCGGFLVWANKAYEDEVRFALATDTLRAGVFDYKVGRRRVFRSRGLSELVGQPKGWGATLADFLSVLCPTERARVLRLFLRETALRNEFQFDVYPRGNREITKVFFVSGQVIRGQDGSIARIVGTISDISGVRAMELNSNRMARRYEVLFERAGDGICLIKDGRYVEVNPKILQIYRVANEEDMLGKAPWDYSPEFQPNGQSSRDLGAEKIQLALSGIPVYFNWVCLRADGTEGEISVSLALLALEDEGAPLLVAHVRDLKHIVRPDEGPAAIWS